MTITVNEAIELFDECREFEISGTLIQQALESGAAHVSICHACADQIEDPEITSATADLV